METKTKEYHKEEYDLFHKPCDHKIVQTSIAHEAIGVEYYDVCADCGATEFDN